MATTLVLSVVADVEKAVSGLKQVDGQTQSMGSTFKAAGMAIAGAFSTQKIVGWAKEWVASGLDAKRALKDVTVVFGQSADGVKAWGETAATSFGMTAAEADKAAAKVGLALKGYGFSTAEAAKASEALVQRSADMAKVLGVDQAEVLAKVETAMRGRTAGLKDYGVQVAKGSDQQAIFNAFMQQTADYAGQADTPIASLHATMGDLSAQLGEALIPVITAVIPLFQTIGDWAKNNKTFFNAIVIVLALLAVTFGIASAAAGVFAIASLGALWPILLVVGAIVGLIAVVVLIIKYWSDLVGWFHTAVSAIQGVLNALGPLILLFGPLGAAIFVVEHFGQAWHAVVGAVDAVYNAIKRVTDIASGVADKIGGIISKIPGLGSVLSMPGASGAAAGPSAYGATPYGAPVMFAPSITITGDVGDPTLAGRRIVAALEAWTAANGRRRIAALVGP
jgi:hypothetical protein